MEKLEKSHNKEAPLSMSLTLLNSIVEFGLYGGSLGFIAGMIEGSQQGRLMHFVEISNRPLPANKDGVIVLLRQMTNTMMKFGLQHGIRRGCKLGLLFALYPAIKAGSQTLLSLKYDQKSKETAVNLVCVSLMTDTLFGSVLFSSLCMPRGKSNLRKGTLLGFSLGLMHGCLTFALSECGITTSSSSESSVLVCNNEQKQSQQ